MKYYITMMIGVALLVLPFSFGYAPYVSIIGLVMAAAGAIQCDKHDKEINDKLNEYADKILRHVKGCTRRG